jgi:hypothetical protein
MPPSRLSLSIEPHGTRCSRERALAWVQMRVVTRGAWPECSPAADGCPESIPSVRLEATCSESSARPSMSIHASTHSLQCCWGSSRQPPRSALYSVRSRASREGGLARNGWAYSDARRWSAEVPHQTIVLRLCRPLIDDLPEFAVLSVNADRRWQDGCND